MTKDKNGENVTHLEITEVVLVYCSIVNNDDQQNLGLLYTLIPRIPKIHIFLKTFNSEFQAIEVWFINSQPLEIEGRINLTLVRN